MYSEQDVRDAVAAGAISAEAAEGLRTYVEGARVAPATDEETFRLLNSFNDIFVTIAAVLLLVAMGGIGRAIAPGAGGLLVAAAAWGMAEYFTKLRRMALPSIVLLLAFVGGVVAGPADLLNSMNLEQLGDRVAVLVFSGVFVLGAVAAWFHWRRFKVPITVAAGAAAVSATAIALVLAAIGPDKGESAKSLILPLVFAAGLAVFAYAMRWDMSDRARETRRSDVAFWLHLLAAPMIAHPLFQWLGISSGDTIGASGAALVLAIYVLFGIVAQAVDPRALLVSARADVLFALTRLFQEFGMVELNVALTALVIGSALLTLSAFWTRIRGGLVRQLPSELQARLPVAGVMAAA
jgi:hypothetical protein